MYKTEITELFIRDKSYYLKHITNIDEVFDQLIQSDNTDINKIDERIPYWTELWPSSLAMCQFILDHEERFKNKNIIEIGAGLAMPSIVASAFSNQVLVTDYLEDALKFARENCELNHVHQVDFQILDWRNILTSQKYDIIIASDIAYERRFFDELPNAIASLMSDEGSCFISEPNRMMAIDFFEKELPKFFKVINHGKYSIDQRGQEVKVNLYECKKIKKRKN